MDCPSIITFPKSEWPDIKTRLAKSKVVFTIRVSQEFDKYKEGEILVTEWGEKVQILSVKKLSGGIEELEKEYEYYSDISAEMISEIRPFKEIEIISIKALLV